LFYKKKNPNSPEVDQILWFRDIKSEIQPLAHDLKDSELVAVPGEEKELSSNFHIEDCLTI